MTTLCFDFGNTRLKCAVFINGDFTQEIVLPEASVNAIQQVLTEFKPANTILSSVIYHDAEIETLLAAQSKFHKLSATSKLPFTTPVSRPETIGADRLALIAAAVHLYPKKHSLVIALGSCITYNYVNSLHQFLGGSITPGMHMRFKAMNDHTALLPLIEAAHEFPLIGYDTRSNLLSGVILGVAGEIDRFIDDYSQKFSNFNVLLTGGDAAFFVPHIKNKIFADPNLIYKGLYAISKHNQ